MSSSFPASRFLDALVRRGSHGFEIDIAIPRMIAAGARNGTYWLGVASRLDALVPWIQPGRSALVKIDGLRSENRIYMVLAEGPPDDGPAFRKDCDDLLSALDDALIALDSSRTPRACSGDTVHSVAEALAEADAVARLGVFITIRLSIEEGVLLYRVSTGRPAPGPCFDNAGIDLLGPLQEALDLEREWSTRKSQSRSPEISKGAKS